MTYLNFVSFFGIFGLCFVAWIFSEDRRLIPWRVIVWGIGLQLVLGFLVFQFEPTKSALEAFSNMLNVAFDAAEEGAQFIFGRNSFMVAASHKDLYGSTSIAFTFDCLWPGSLCFQVIHQ